MEPSAAEAAVAFWNVVADHARRFNEGRDKVFDRLQHRLERIEAGSDGDFDVARASLGFRLPPGLDPRELRSELERLRAGLPGPEIALEASASERAFVADRRSVLVRSFVRSIRAAEERPRLKVKTGTSDMNVVGPVWRCPILAYGPGDSRLDHAPEEHLVLDEYLKAVEVLRRAVGGLVR